MTAHPRPRAELLAAAPLFAGVDADGHGADRRSGRSRSTSPPTTSSPARARSAPGSSSSRAAAPGRPRRGRRSPTLGPGDFFGELSVLDGQPRIAQVIADGPTTCLALASWDFEAVVREQPAVALAILRGLAGRLRGLTEAHRH